MPRRWVLGITAAGLALALAMPRPAAGKKLALLVGIDAYAAVTPLHGAVNDVESLKTVLIGKFEFPPANIAVLRDGAATRARILEALSDLIGRTESGDIVVFHFSGHGSRMHDVSGDEADDWDETIVPQDSRTPGVGGDFDDFLAASRDPDPGVRLEAVNGISRSGASEAQRALERLAEDEVPEVRLLAVQELRRRAGQP